MPDGTAPAAAGQITYLNKHKRPAKALIHLAPEAGDLNAASYELGIARSIIDSLFHNEAANHNDKDTLNLLAAAADGIRRAKAIIDEGPDA